MKRTRSILSTILILTAGACIDPVILDVGSAVLDTIVINGSITNEPGPYRVSINVAFDLNSEEGFRNPVSAKRVIISDNTGASEELKESRQGVYLTSANGIQGVVGRTYTLRVEMAGGRVYESLPDTLLEAGAVENVNAVFTEGKNGLATTYGFDVMFHPVSNSENNSHLMWKFTGTYQAITFPEAGVHAPCEAPTCTGCSYCNFRPPCSGIRNMSPFTDLPRAIFVRVGPCECCTCWYNFYNPVPMLSEGQFLKDGATFAEQKAMYVPLDAWMFKYKVHAKVSQFTLTKQAFDFWTAVRDQKEAVGSLFQPVTGKIKGNFVQVSGNETPVEGMFFAAGVASQSIFIEREDVPSTIPIPEPGIPFADSCLKLAAYATTQKPDFWD